MPAQTIRPDSIIQTINNTKTVFLAGTIDNGNSVDWQKETIAYLQDTAVTFMNPRREHWHPDIEQTISNPEFNHQVNWELNKPHQRRRYYILFYWGNQQKSNNTNGIGLVSRA